MYKLHKDINGVENGVVKENSFIPFDPSNTDYKAYLKWLEEGNTPLPADEVTA